MVHECDNRKLQFLHRSSPRILTSRNFSTAGFEGQSAFKKVQIQNRFEMKSNCRRGSFTKVVPDFYLSLNIATFCIMFFCHSVPPLFVFVATLSAISFLMQLYLVVSSLSCVCGIVVQGIKKPQALGVGAQQ